MEVGERRAAMNCSLFWNDSLVAAACLCDRWSTVGKSVSVSLLGDGIPTLQPTALPWAPDLQELCSGQPLCAESD